MQYATKGSFQKVQNIREANWLKCLDNEECDTASALCIDIKAITAHIQWHIFCCAS